MPRVYHLVLSNHSGSCIFDLANSIQCCYTQHEQFCVIVFQKGRDGTFPSLPTSCLDTLLKNGKAGLMLKPCVSHSQTVGCRGLKQIRHYFNAKFKPSPPLSCLPPAWACRALLGCSSSGKSPWDDSVSASAGHACLFYDLRVISGGNVADESSVLSSGVWGHGKASIALSRVIKELCLRIHIRNS